MLYNENKNQHNANKHYNLLQCRVRLNDWKYGNGYKEAWIDEDFENNAIYVDVYDCEGVCKQTLQKDKTFLRAIKFADSVIWFDEYTCKIKFY